MALKIKRTQSEIGENHSLSSVIVPRCRHCPDLDIQASSLNNDYQHHVTEDDFRQEGLRINLSTYNSLKLIKSILTEFAQCTSKCPNKNQTLSSNYLATTTQGGSSKRQSHWSSTTAASKFKRRKVAARISSPLKVPKRFLLNARKMFHTVDASPGVHWTGLRHIQKLTRLVERFS